MKTPSRSAAAFSLVEVLAAVAIIGIIVFIAIPNVVQSRRDAEEHFAISRAEAINSAIGQFIQANGRANAGVRWALAADQEAKYVLIRGYLAYAPAALSSFQPTGYTFTLPNSPDAKVGIAQDTGVSGATVALNY